MTHLIAFARASASTSNVLYTNHMQETCCSITTPSRLSSSAYSLGFDRRQCWLPFQSARLHCSCRAKTEPEKRLRAKTSSKTGGSRKQTRTEDSEADLKWGFFDLAAYNQPWQVPWGKKETALGFIGWILTFLIVSLLTIPGILLVTGASFEDVSSQEKVGYIVLNQILETGFGIGIVLYLLRNYRPLPKEIFSLSLENPVRKPDGWLIWGSVGFLLAPILVSIVLNIFTVAGYTEDGPGTVDEVVKIITPDVPTFAGLFSVTSILAPLLEEFVFRGFLLTSLTAFMPVPFAIAGSSVAFGLAHLSIKDFPELTALGVLLACSYVRSRNLMAPILIHGLWNGAVLVALFAVPDLAQ